MPRFIITLAWGRRNPGLYQGHQNDFQGSGEWATPSPHCQTRHTESSKKAGSRHPRLQSILVGIACLPPSKSTRLDLSVTHEVAREKRGGQGDRRSVSGCVTRLRLQLKRIIDTLSMGFLIPPVSHYHQRWTRSTHAPSSPLASYPLRETRPF